MPTRITDVWSGAQRIRQARYGTIDAIAGRLDAIQLRRWPLLFLPAELVWLDNWRQSRGRGDRCQLYYDQPLRHPGFIVLKYIRSSPGASFRTVRAALIVLDQIARIKRADALLCQVRNLRISDRVLLRFGWERHLLRSRRRHFIKRFYGVYPTPGPSCQEPAAGPLDKKTAQPSALPRLILPHSGEQTPVDCS